MYIHPFPDDFWGRTSVRALGPTPAYIGPMPSSDQDALAIARGASARAYVYVVMSDWLDVLYVGKTVAGRLVLLGVDGVDRRDAEAAALHLERLAIRVLNPIHNVAGVLV